uniref:Voltage-gated hydrogen channel 1 n=1 Tax=Strigamia maritima TaxID=126957 RepID=T1JNY0_STRMM
MDNHHSLSEDLEKIIMKEDTTSSLTTEDDHNIQQHNTFRERVTAVLHSHKFQVAIIVLVIFDCLLVIGELLIDLESKDEHNEIAEILHYLSMSVLSVFLVEIMVKVYAFRLEFFHHKLEIFDAIVVIVSFGLDVSYAHIHSAVNGLGLLIIFRLWRVTRILNGIVMSVKMQSERRLHKEKRAREALEHELAKFRQYCAAQEEEIEALRSLLRKNGISEVEMVARSPAPVNTLNVIAEVNHFNEINEKGSV